MSCTVFLSLAIPIPAALSVVQVSLALPICSPRPAPVTMLPVKSMT